jgi:hypothetical protein
VPKINLLILVYARQLKFVVFTIFVFKIRSEYVSDKEYFSIEIFAKASCYHTARKPLGTLAPWHVCIGCKHTGELDVSSRQSLAKMIRVIRVLATLIHGSNSGMLRLLRVLRGLSTGSILITPRSHRYIGVFMEQPLRLSMVNSLNCIPLPEY